MAASVDWLLWQLADSAFPTGGFAHSGGLEAAWQAGEVRNRADLAQFLEAALAQVARGSLPFVLEVFEGNLPLAKVDQLSDAFLTNHVANRASRLQGRALLNAAARAFPQTKAIQQNPREHPCHLAPVSGAVFRALGLERDSSLRLFLFTHLRGWLSAAVRLNIIGPIEAQAVQAEVAARAEPLIAREYSIESAAQTAPIIEIFQAGHDRLYSKLFQS
jgi:urease accessory protein